MSSKTLQKRISIDPEICFSKTHITGTRITVDFVLDLLSSRYSIQDIIEEYSHLSEEDVIAAIEYAKEVIKNE